MSDILRIKKENGHHGIVLTIVGIGLLITGIILGMGLSGDLSFSQGDSSKAEIGVSSPSTKPLLSGALLFGEGDIGARNSTLTQVAKQARHAVVNISTTVYAKKLEPLQSPFFDDPFFRRFFGEEFEKKFQPQKFPPQQGTGSGVIVRKDGYIITNNHVVESGDEIQVTLSDKRNFTAEVIGTDPKTDLALIKIDADDLPVLPWGDSQKLEVGEIVMAVGNPFGLTQTVTMGIVSAVGRANVGIVDYEDFIQTDAAINPGNSGGALVNLKGELIGINTAIFSRSGGYMGIGFAIPSNMAQVIQTSLIEHGKVVRGWLGVSIQDLTPDLQDQFEAPDIQGALVSEVIDDSPAQQAGFQRGDIIRQFDTKTVKDTHHLRALVAESVPNASVKVQVFREGEDHELTVTIEEMPKDLVAKANIGETQGSHALSGVTVESAPSGERGVTVTKVESGSPAGRAGIQKGDHILEINREAVKDVKDFQRLTGKLGAKDKILLLLQRGRSTIFISITP